MDVMNATALVTGGASGLGEATVRALVTLGAKVLIVDRDGERAERLAGSLGAQAMAAVADVTS
jgi:NAD(P)-dependent dehydrogenase (short-subunit alcohol dehydrogenase family)